MRPIFLVKMMATYNRFDITVKLWLPWSVLMIAYHIQFVFFLCCSRFFDAHMHPLTAAMMQPVMSTAANEADAQAAATKTKVSNIIPTKTSTEMNAEMLKITQVFCYFLISCFNKAWSLICGYSEFWLPSRTKSRCPQFQVLSGSSLIYQIVVVSIIITLKCNSMIQKLAVVINHRKVGGVV